MPEGGGPGGSSAFGRSVNPISTNEGVDYAQYITTAPTHTASFWNIIIQWTSHDDLTENISCSISLAKLVK